MPQDLRGEKRAIMSVWDDFIHRLEQDLAVEGTLNSWNRAKCSIASADDPWVDTTQGDIDWHKKTIGMYEGLIRKLRAERGE